MHSPAQPKTGLRSSHQWHLWLAGLVGSRYDGLVHFHVVTPGVLLRCGQPHTRDLDTIRGEHGLKTIVCARGGTRHPLRGRWFRKERAWCSAQGVQLVHMPFSDAAVPPADVFAQFVQLARDPTNHPILVHCEQGFHRTGILCAAYRIEVERWTWEDAVAEMQRFGFELDRPKRRPLFDALREYVGRANE